MFEEEYTIYKYKLLKNEDSLLVKRQIDNTTSGGNGLDQRELVLSISNSMLLKPVSHQLYSNFPTDRRLWASLALYCPVMYFDAHQF